MRRRDFLKLTAVMAAGSLSWRLWAAPTGGSQTRCLVVFLRGAYDSLNALVPYADDFYYQSRPNIALPRPDKKDPQAVIALDARWGMAASLQDDLHPLYAAKQLAFVPFAGTGFVSRSHFQAQDWVEFGQPATARPNSDSGFLNRLLRELGAGTAPRPEAVSFTQTLPPILTGTMPVANSPISLPRSRQLTPHFEQLVLQMYTGHALEQQVSDGLGLRKAIASELVEEMQAASRDATAPGGFALEAGRIGRLLRERPELSVGFIDVGGWDTHAAQGGASGALSTRLQALSAGLAELETSLGNGWNNTVVMVLSEFGRTFRENGSRGTDHGHGTAMWVLGGSISGGRIVGEQADLAPGKLHQDRDLPVLNEYRAVLGGLFRHMYGLNPAQLARIFPSSTPADLGLL
ncbi:DUF1501 domain-containing protein [Zobellella endophytica]|uniref:DUF1501 domain-containing protein n=1 Tax=Zobellella endophytica TaxID=2116700 RepID=A0A2P7RCY8_9GAMM|nr:DUF1501 domain-containing protein [Zobellella endophytica]PSJ48040.1 DUF1501 domain-containing protein [Zobellella endophytica]